MNKTQTTLLILILVTFSQASNTNASSKKKKDAIEFDLDDWIFEDSIIYNSKKISIKYIESLNDLYKNLYELKKNSQNKLLFRGHSSCNYTLLPSRMRDLDMASKEFIHTQYFIKERPELVLHSNHNSDALIKIQHYGLGTRLLDITDNYTIALYFACEKFESNGEVIVFETPLENIKFRDSARVNLIASLPFLEKEKVDVITSRYDDSRDIPSLPEDDKKAKIECYNKIEEVGYLVGKVKKEIPAFVPRVNPTHLFDDYFFYGMKNNRRIVNQSGAFILCGLYHKYPGEIAERLLNKTIRKEDKRLVFIIKQSDKGKIINELNDIGINEKFIYPEIEYTAKWIKENV